MSLENVDFQSIVHQHVSDLVASWQAVGFGETEIQEAQSQFVQFGCICANQLIQEKGLTPQGAKDLIEYTPPMAERILQFFLHGLNVGLLKAHEMKLPRNETWMLLQQVALHVFEHAKQAVIATLGQELTPDVQISDDQMINSLGETAVEALMYFHKEHVERYGKIEYLPSGAQKSLIARYKVNKSKAEQMQFYGTLAKSQGEVLSEAIGFLDWTEAELEKLKMALIHIYGKNHFDLNPGILPEKISLRSWQDLFAVYYWGVFCTLLWAKQAQMNDLQWEALFHDLDRFLYLESELIQLGQEREKVPNFSKKLTRMLNKVNELLKLEEFDPDRVVWFYVLKHTAMCARDHRELKNLYHIAPQCLASVNQFKASLKDPSATTENANLLAQECGITVELLDGKLLTTPNPIKSLSNFFLNRKGSRQR